MKQKYINIIIITLVLFATAGCKVEKETKEIQKAIFEIQNIENDKVYSLAGDWEFYHNNFIAPEAFHNYSSDTVQYQHVHSDWEDYIVNNKQIDAHGYGTFHLKVILPKDNDVYALKINRIYTSYKLWINDTLLVEKGVTGKNAENTVVAITPEVVPFRASQDTNNIVIQVSNFEYKKGGIAKPAYIGKIEAISHQGEENLVLMFIFLGTYLLSAIYLLLTSLVYAKSRLANLFFSLMIILNTLFQMANGELYITYFFPNLSWDTLMLLDYFGNYGQTIFTFLALYFIFKHEKIYSKIIITPLISLLIILDLSILVIPTVYYGYTQAIFFVILWLLSFYSVFIIGKLAFKKNRKARLLFIGYGIFLITSLHDTLLHFNLINSITLLNFGSLAFTLFYTIILSLNSFTVRENYGKTLRNSEKLDGIQKHFFKVRSFDLLRFLEILAEELKIKEISVFVKIDGKYKCEATYIDGKEDISYLSKPIEYKLEPTFFEQFENSSKNLIATDEYLVCKINEPNGHKKYIYFENIENIDLATSVIGVLEYEISLAIENYITYYTEKNLNTNFDQILDSRIEQIKSQKEELLTQENNLAIKYEEIIVAKKKVEELNNISLEKVRKLQSNIESIEQINKKVLEQKDIISKNIKVVNENLKYSNRIHNILVGIITRSIDISYCKYTTSKQIISGDFLYIKEIDEKLLILLVDIGYHDTIALFFTSYIFSLLSDITRAKEDDLINNPDNFVKFLKNNYVKALGFQENLKNFSHFMAIMDNAGLMKYCSQDIIAHVVSDENLIDLSAIQTSNDNKFTQQYVVKKFNFKENDRLYLQTDGLLRQLNPEMKEFGSERIEKLVLELAKHDIKENQTIVEKTLNEWKKEAAQVDDYLIFGYDFIAK